MFNADVRLDTSALTNTTGTETGVIMIEHYDSVDVFVGVDVGKGEHHAIAYDHAGKVLFNKARAEFFIATGRVRHGERVSEVPRGRIPANVTLRERMALMAEGGRTGITTMPVLQSLAQARTKWSDNAAGTTRDATIVKVTPGGGSNSRDLHDLSTVIVTKRPTRPPSAIKAHGHLSAPSDAYPSCLQTPSTPCRSGRG